MTNKEKKCENCIYWEQENYSHIKLDYGICTQIKFQLDFDLKSGLDGCYVDMVYTEKDFYCKYFKQKKS